MAISHVVGRSQCSPGSPDFCQTETMKIDRRRPDLLVADGLFHATQLRTLESFARTANYESQRLSPGGVRDRQRAVLDNPQIEMLRWDALAPIVGEPADWFEESASPVQSPPIGGWAVTGCNPRTRVYSYGLGGSFSPHQDEAWQPNQATKTLLTVLG